MGAGPCLLFITIAWVPVRGKTAAGNRPARSAMRQGQACHAHTQAHHRLKRSSTHFFLAAAWPHGTAFSSYRHILILNLSPCNVLDLPVVVGANSLAYRKGSRLALRPATSFTSQRTIADKAAAFLIASPLCTFSQRRGVTRDPRLAGLSKLPAASGDLHLQAGRCGST